MTGLLVFLVSLPLAVYTYAGGFALIDHGNRFQALLSLSFRLLLVATLLLVTPTGSRGWIAAGFLLVLVLHGSASMLLRHALNGDRWITGREE